MTGRRFSKWAGFGRVVSRLPGFLLSLAVLLILSVSAAQSHDPAAWGGLFRSRDDGATWMSANRGYYLSGAIALAVSPADPDHLLLGAETGLFRSHNGGRDWVVEAPSVIVGSVFAATFAADGRRALISTSLGIFCSICSLFVHTWSHVLPGPLERSFFNECQMKATGPPHNLAADMPFDSRQF